MNEQSPEAGNEIENVGIVITQEAVVRSLQENPQNMEVLRVYIDSKMKQIQAPYVSHEDAKKLTVAHSLELAEIYKEAGMIEDAADTYNDAADLAQANGMEEEYREILAELAKI